MSLKSINSLVMSEINRHECHYRTKNVHQSKSDSVMIENEHFYKYLQLIGNSV